MIRRVRASLTVKLLLITAALLAASCVLTYSFIAWMMPKTYRSTLSEGLAERVDLLVSMLEQTTMTESEALINQFVRETRTEVRIYDESGTVVLKESVPQAEMVYEGLFIAVTAVESVEDEGTEDYAVGTDSVVVEDTAGYTTGYAAVSDSVVVEDSDYAVDEADGTFSVGVATERSAAQGDDPVLLRDGNTYKVSVAEGTFLTSGALTTTLGYGFRFADSDETYMIYVHDSMREVNEAEEALRQTLPLLVLAIAAVSMLGAFVFSRYVTRPIVRLSGLSRRLAALDFTWVYEDKRTDEIGVLGRNLSVLAARLSAALSELRSANDALRGEMEHERAAQRQRSAFFSAVSHELKTPLTVIKGQLEGMIGQVGVYADRETYLARALKVTESMEAMVREILLLSRAEATPEAVRVEAVDLGALLRERMARHTELFGQRGMAVLVEAPDGVTVMADRAQLARAVDNLVANAATHAPEGARVWAWAGRDESGRAALTVENEGAPVPEEALGRVFEAFYRVDASRNRQTGGSGLGLYIVRTIAERYGATCTMENTPRGVKVTVGFRSE